MGFSLQGPAFVVPECPDIFTGSAWAKTSRSPGALLSRGTAPELHNKLTGQRVLWAVANYPHRKDLTQAENVSYSAYCGIAELEAEVLTAVHDEEDTESEPVIVLSPVSGHRD